jgi:hypothetical protein
MPLANGPWPKSVSEETLPCFSNVATPGSLRLHTGSPYDLDPPPECGRQALTTYLRNWVQSPFNTSTIFILPHIIQQQWCHVACYIKEHRVYHSGFQPPECRFESHLPFVLLLFVTRTGWSNLPLPSLKVGINTRLRRCVGCHSGRDLNRDCLYFPRKGLLSFHRPELGHTLWDSLSSHMLPSRPPIQDQTKGQQGSSLSPRSRPHVLPQLHLHVKLVKCVPSWDGNYIRHQRTSTYYDLCWNAKTSQLCAQRMAIRWASPQELEWSPYDYCQKPKPPK